VALQFHTSNWVGPCISKVHKRLLVKPTYICSEKLVTQRSGSSVSSSFKPRGAMHIRIAQAFAGKADIHFSFKTNKWLVKASCNAECWPHVRSMNMYFFFASVELNIHVLSNMKKNLVCFRSLPSPTSWQTKVENPATAILCLQLSGYCDLEVEARLPLGW